VQAAANYAQSTAADMLIVDTVSQFAGLRGDAEINSGDALAAVELLQAAAGRGLAVVATRHERQGGGQVGDAGRGSSAFSGAVDIVISIRRGAGQGEPMVRVLHALSRFSETPESLVIDLAEHGYVALGTEGTLAVLEAERAIIRRGSLADQAWTATGAASTRSNEEAKGWCHDGRQPTRALRMWCGGLARPSPVHRAEARSL